MSTSQNEFKYPHYHKNVAHLKYVDVYRVLILFGVTDPCLQHAIKKLLCAGNRTQDVQEAISSLLRYLEMQTENENEK